MNYKEQVIYNFKELISSRMPEIIETFIKTSEHNNMHSSLFEEKNKIYESYNVLNKEHEFLSTYPSISPKIYLDLKASDAKIDWIEKIDLILNEEFKTDEQKISWIKENMAEAKALIAQTYPGSISLNDWKILINNYDFKIDNQEVIKEVDEICEALFIMREVNNFVDNLNAEISESLYVYRSLAVGNVDLFLASLIDGSQEKGLGEAWSRSLSKANSYDGDKNLNHVKLFGKISPNCIDYFKTIVKNISMAYRREKELVLVPELEIMIYKVQIYDFNNELLKVIELDQEILRKI